MPENTVWLHITLGILLFLSVCCFIAVFAESVRQMLSGFFTIFYRPLSMIQERTSTYIQNVRTWILSQLEYESEREGEGPLYYIIGSVLYTILTVFFILCDFGMIVLTAEAMGLDKSSVQLPLDTSTLTAATLVTTSLFWGAIFFDLLGVTRLAPWRKSLSVISRRILMGISVFMFILSVFVGVAMAYWRGNMTTQFIPEAEASAADSAFLNQGGLSLSETGGNVTDVMPADIFVEEDLPPLDDSANWIINASLMGISGLSISATAFSVVGMIILVKFVILLVIGICMLPLLPVTFFAWLISLFFDLIFNVVQRIVDFIVNIGSTILRRFGWQPTNSENQSYVNETDSRDRPDGINSRTQPKANTASADLGFNPFQRK